MEVQKCRGFNGKVVVSLEPRQQQFALWRARQTGVTRSQCSFEEEISKLLQRLWN